MRRKGITMVFRELEKSNWVSGFGYNYYTAAQLERHIIKRTEDALETGDAKRAGITDLHSFETRRNAMRKEFIDRMGGLPVMDTPLNPVHTGDVRGNGFTIEKIIFESRPGIYVTCNLYRLDRLTGRRPAVIFTSGHFNEAKAADEYQTACQYFMQAGFVVLAMDPTGQGERATYYEKDLKRESIRMGTMDHNATGFMCLPLGQSIMRYFVHDIMRAYDYLAGRPDVDKDKICVTGNSGGGTQTALAMICDTRIAAAAPATWITNRRAYLYAGQTQDMEQLWCGISAYGFDHEDAMYMTAPKPTVLLAAAYDFFPVEGVKENYHNTKRFWEYYGEPDNYQLLITQEKHMYSPEMAKFTASFFLSKLTGETAEFDDGAIVLFPVKQLECTKSGQAKGDFTGARTVFDDNLDTSAALADSRRAAAVGQRDVLYVNQRQIGRKYVVQGRRVRQVGKIDQERVEF